MFWNIEKFVNGISNYFEINENLEYNHFITIVCPFFSMFFYQRFFYLFLQHLWHAFDVNRSFFLQIIINISLELSIFKYASAIEGTAQKN